MSALATHGLQPLLIVSDGPQAQHLAVAEGAVYAPVRMAREPRPLSDLLALVSILRILVRYRPLAVNAGTPKAGFLTILAAFITRVPVRVYTLRGLRHEPMTGLARRVQRLIERVTCRLATSVIAISPSLQLLAEHERLAPAATFSIIGHGGSGVDLQRFTRSAVSESDTTRLRQSLGISQTEFVVGFVGSMTPRKGLLDLVKAWHLVASRTHDARLLLVGPIDPQQPLPDSFWTEVDRDGSIKYLGEVPPHLVPLHMSVFDLFVLPSHGEGFGNVLVEAAALGLPVVSTKATGVRDAVSHDLNGTLVPVKDPHSLSKAILNYMASPALRISHGEAGLQWAMRFSRTERAHQTATFIRGLTDEAASTGP